MRSYLVSLTAFLLSGLAYAQPAKAQDDTENAVE